MTEKIPKMFVLSSVLLHPPFQNDNHMLVPIVVDRHIKTIGFYGYSQCVVGYDFETEADNYMCMALSERIFSSYLHGFSFFLSFVFILASFS